LCSLLRQLLSTNGRKKSKQLSELYRIRKNRFRHAVAAFVRQLVMDLYARGVSTIVIGELTGTRSGSSHGRQGNAMVHNCWSHKHVADRLKWTAEECGIKNSHGFGSLHEPDLYTMSFTARSARFPMSRLRIGGA
jgi:transposase